MHVCTGGFNEKVTKGNYTDLFLGSVIERSLNVSAFSTTFPHLNHGKESNMLAGSVWEGARHEERSET